MERDMDLIRRIALEVAQLPMGKQLDHLKDVNQGEFAMHAQWMAEAGLIHATLNPKDGKAPATSAFIWRLTWQGCEFADSIRNDTLWKKAKETVFKPGLSFSFEVLKEWLKDEITQRIHTMSS